MIGIIDCGCPTIKELEYLVDQFDDHTTIPLLDLDGEPSDFDAFIISSSVQPLYIMYSYFLK